MTIQKVEWFYKGKLYWCSGFVSNRADGELEVKVFDQGTCCWSKGQTFILGDAVDIVSNLTNCTFNSKFEDVKIILDF